MVHHCSYLQRNFHLVLFRGKVFHVGLIPTPGSQGHHLLFQTLKAPRTDCGQGPMPSPMLSVLSSAAFFLHHSPTSRTQVPSLLQSGPSCLFLLPQAQFCLVFGSGKSGSVSTLSGFVSKPWACSFCECVFLVTVDRGALGDQ